MPSGYRESSLGLSHSASMPISFYIMTEIEKKEYQLKFLLRNHDEADKALCILLYLVPILMFSVDIFSLILSIGKDDHIRWWAMLPFYLFTSLIPSYFISKHLIKATKTESISKMPIAEIVPIYLKSVWFRAIVVFISIYGSLGSIDLAIYIRGINDSLLINIIGSILLIVVPVILWGVAYLLYIQYLQPNDLIDKYCQWKK